MNLNNLFSKAVTLSMLLIVLSCNKEDPLPTFNVGFTASPNNPTAGETVTFTNASQGGSTWEWDFGDGSAIVTTADATHVYEAAGTYTVSLIPDGRTELMFTQDITVAEPSPTISYTPANIQLGVEITFTAAIYNPNSSAVTYTWEFPVGTQGDADPNTGVATGESVKVIFTEANSSTAITVTAAIEGKNLSTTQTVDVKDQLAKTLYIGSKSGNILTKKIYLNGEAQLEDTGIPAGPHPLTLDFENDRLFVFNGGTFITFTADPETEPGQIFSFNHDLTGYTTHITFNTASAYDDAFFGDVVSDGSGGVNIYWTDRRNDVTMISGSTENATWNTESGDGNPAEFPAFVANSGLGYYSAYRTDGGPTYGWGAVNGTFKNVDGVYWWAKNSNHKGLWRFSDDDIGVTDQVPAEGSILTDYAVRSFAIDQVNSKVYFCSNNGLARGFFVANTDGSGITLIDDAPYDGEGGENEPTYITGIAIDNESGYVYWAYRGPAAADLETNPTHASGIKRWKLDGTGEVEYFIQDVEAYGLAIDNTKR